MRKRIKKYQNSGAITANVGGELATYIPGQDAYQIASLLPNIIVSASSKKKTPQVTVPDIPSIPKTFEVTNSIKQAQQQVESSLRSQMKSNVTPQTKSSNLSSIASLAGGIAGSVANMVPSLDKVKNENDSLTQGLKDSANQMLLSGVAGPWGVAAGAISTIVDKTGGYSDASQGLGTGNDIGNAVASIIPGLGWLTGKTADYTMSDELKSSTGYTGTAKNGETAEKNAGAKLLFGKNKANKMIGLQNQQDQQVQKILQNADMANAASNNPLIGLQTQLGLMGGYQQNTVRAGKSGLKMDREFAKKVIKLSKGKKKATIAEFKNGGTVNVIPDGALHKNKHHLENIDEKFEDVTSKGIPVITEGEGGITQHAEVEREEIIFNLDVTKQLEKLMSDGSDEAAIEAGKLLVYEILENTIDNTGLLKKV